MASEGRQIERCHKHEQMAAKRLEKSEIVSEADREREREKGRENLDQAEKGLEFTLGNAVSRTGKTYIPKYETQK